MSAATWFEDLPVLGRMAPEEAAAKLREIGEDQAASALEKLPPAPRPRLETFALPEWIPFQVRPWQYTAHAFGYLPPAAPGNDPLPIQHAGNIEPDVTLKNSRIKIALNRLRIADYPGGGAHQILFDFYAQNQLPGEVEHVHFNATLRVQEGQQAGIINIPIFIGLYVGTEGVAFKCLTVNVQNDADEKFLSFLDSEVFQAGLKLVATAQPAIAPLSQMAVGLTKAIAKRNRNVPVQDIQMGLDFSYNPHGARLAEGDYIAVQVPDKLCLAWDWEEWAYHPKKGEIVNIADHTRLIPYNYVVLGISRYTEP